MTEREGPAELELKFRLDDTTIERLAARGGFTPDTLQARSRLRSVYFDTPDGALMAARAALRVRRTPDGHVQTVKAEGDGLFDRFEWERPVSGEAPERDALPPADTAVGELLHAHFDRLAPLFVTDFERGAWVLQPTSTLRIELALDRGEVRAGDGAGLAVVDEDGQPLAELTPPSLPVLELEAERLAGAPVAFWRWALRFARRFRLRLAMATKNERGLRLAGRLPPVPAPVKATPRTADADVPAARAAADAVQACLAHFAANVDPLLEGEDPGAAHQARVALRRLRAAVRFFELPAHDPAWADVAARAKALADDVGALRDLDVFAQGTLASVRRALPDETGLATLAEGVERLRLDARRHARERIGGHDTTVFVIDALLQVARLRQPSRANVVRAPRPDPHDRMAPFAGTPLLAPQAAPSGPAAPEAASAPDLHGTAFGAFARSRIDGLAAKLARRAKRAESADDWHRARIAAKNLRYALEFCAAALPHPKRAAKAMTRLSKLQDRLGLANDRAVAIHMAARAAEATGRKASRRAAARPDADGLRGAALVQGWLAHARGLDEADADALRAEIRDLRRALRADD